MPAELSATIGSAFDSADLKGWLPVDLIIRDSSPGVLWRDMRGLELSEPFFHQTVERVRRERTNGERFTDLDTLVQLESEIGISPTGFIFHASRCGSTVITNACKAVANTLVISEAFAVDKLITRFLTDVRNDRRRELVYSVFLRAVVNVLGQRRTESQLHYLLKFSSLSVLQLKRIKKIWPNVPCVFVYRDPVEVMVSNLDYMPEWMRVEADALFAAAVIGCDQQSVLAMSPEEYCARVIGRLLTVERGSLGEQSRLLNYEELSLESLLDLMDFFGLKPTQSELAAIESSLRIYAKDEARVRPFVSDSRAKRGAASQAIQTMCNKWAREPYLELERIRLNDSAGQRK